MIVKTRIKHSEVDQDEEILKTMSKYSLATKDKPQQVAKAL